MKRSERLGLVINIAGWMLLLVMLATQAMSWLAALLAGVAVLAGAYVFVDHGDAQ